MIRGMCVTAGALAGAVALSQYPAFSQQYVQRLAGQVQALDQVVADFDRSALAQNLTRTDALSQMTGTPFLTARQADMRGTFRRHAVLTDDLARLRAATDIDRVAMVHRLGDPATFAGTWSDFQPAMPLGLAGLICAVIGAVFGGLAGVSIAAVLGAVLRRVVRPRRRRRHVSTPRAEPTLSRTAPRAKGPRLSGVRRGV